MDEADIWIRIGFAVLVCFVISLFVYGCNSDAEQNNTIPTGEIQNDNLISNTVYKYKVQVKYKDSMIAATFYCEDVTMKAMFDFITLHNCKDFDGNLFIPYYNVLWFKYNEYDGKDEEK